MRNVAVVTGRNMASVVGEAQKIAQAFIDNGDKVEMYQFDRFIQTNKFDVIVWWTPLLPMFIAHQRKWLNPYVCNYCISYYVIEGHVYGIYAWKEWLKWQYITTPSQFVKSVIEQEGVGVKEIIPHQINKDMPIDHAYGTAWRRRFPANKKILLYNGSQIYRKALPKLKQAIDILSRNRNDFVMVFHTDKLKVSFHTPIDQLFGQNIVVEPDFPNLPIEKAYAKMNYADIIVHPAVVEGFGLPILEAFNLSKPLVCINAPGVNEIANTENSFMVTNVSKTTLEWRAYIKFDVVDYSPHDLAEQIRLALDSSPELLAEKKTRGFETAKKYYNTYQRFTEI